MIALNPVVTTLPREGGLLSVVVSLACEIAVIVVLLRGEQVRSLALVGFLIPLNFVTWNLLNLGHAMLAGQGRAEVAFILLAEAAVVLLEAWALIRFSAWVARRTVRARASRGRILRAVFFGNVVSFLVGMIFAPPVPMSLETVRMRVVENDLARLRAASFKFCLRENRAPESYPDLLRDLGRVGELRDPWGEPYRVVRRLKRLRLTSSGPDREADTEDDLVVWCDLPEFGR